MNWPFVDPPNFVAFSTRHVMERGAPIVLVSHESEDGSWQFIDADFTEDGLVVVCLEHAVNHDPTVAELADLPLGWMATRAFVGGPWHRELIADPDT